MRLLADWKEIRKRGKAERLRATINKLELHRRAIQAEQLKLTNQAELLEGTCEICDGEPVLSGLPLFPRLRRSSPASSLR